MTNKNLTLMIVTLMLSFFSMTVTAQEDDFFADNTNTLEEPVATGLDDINVYPNPAHGRFTVSFQCHDNSAFRIALYNLVGNEVFSNTYYRESGIYSRHFDTNQYEPGVYLLRISCNGETTTQKVIIKG